MSYNISLELLGTSTVVSNPVNAAFVGLSLETSGLNYFLGNVSHPNTYFINLLIQLGHAQNAQLTLRIGGDTQDSTWFNPNLSTDIIVERHLNNIPREWVTLGPLAFDHMRNMSSTIPINWVIGLNFNQSAAANPENALSMAKAAKSSLGENIYAFEIGNEPDNFVRVKKRPPGWSMTDYVQEWIPFALKLQQAVPSAGHNGIEGAVFGGGGWNIADLLDYKINGTSFIDTYRSNIKGISKHQYQASNCNPGSPPAIQDLLNHTSIENNVRYAVSGLSPVDLATYSFRLGEYNSIGCEGRDGLSNSFASTLWAIDYMMLLAYYNVTACNIHNRFPSYYNVADRSGGQWKAQPIWYSLLFISQAFRDSSGNGVSVCSLTTGSSNIVAYGLYDQQILKSVVVINLNQGSANNQEGQNITLTIDANNSQYSAQPFYVSSLVAESIVSQSGIHWANQTMDGSSDGHLHGKPHATILQPIASNSSLTYSFAVKAFSAHLLEYRKPVVNQGSHSPSSASSASSVYVEIITWSMILLTLGFFI